MTTDAGGTANFNVQLPPVSSGHFLSATATAPLGNTSGFAVSLLVGDANPGPTLTDITPANAMRNSAAFKLMVNGAIRTRFGCAVERAGAATTFVSTTQITATIPASDLTLAVCSPFRFTTAAGRRRIEQPKLYGQQSRACPDRAQSNSTLTGSGQFTLTVTGTGFEPESVI